MNDAHHALYVEKNLRNKGMQGQKLQTDRIIFFILTRGAGHCTALGHPLYNIVHLHGLPGVVHCTGAGKDSGKGTQIHTPFDNRKEAFRNPISGIYLRSLKSGSQKDTTSLPCSLQHESQQPRCRNNSDVLKQMNGQRKHCVCVQENVIQPLKKRQFFNM